MSTPWLTIAGFKNRSKMPSSDVDSLARHRYEKRSADAQASTDTPETRFAEIVVTTTLASVILVALSAVAADATDYATVTISKRTAGDTPVVVAQLSTDATSFPAGVPVAIPIVVADVTEEDVLTVTITKSGAGVSIPQLSIDVRPTANFVTQALAQNQAWIEARLAKRYKIPFEAPAPEAASRWLTSLTTNDCYGRRGFNPGSEQDRELVIEAAKTAATEVKEAADSKDGLFELPLRDDDDPQATAVSKGAPLGYSEQSPYVAFDKQLEIGSQEDAWGRGTGS
jgi:hypothetical protein